MTVQEIINRARRLYYTNSVQYTDAQAIEDFNIIYKDLCNSITQEVNEDFFWDIFKTDTAASQSEYTLDTTVNKVENLSIIYEDWWDYVTVTQRELSSLPFDAEYYQENQNKSNPFYEIKDESIFIYPYPDDIISNWLKMRAIITPSSLTISDTTLLLPDRYHYIITEWLSQFIYQSRWKISEKNDSINNYNNKKEEMLFQLTDRNNQPTDNILPYNLSKYA